MYLSIVTTLYSSAAYLKNFYSRMSAAAQQITNDYEIVMVNDGSPDNSLDIAVSLYERDERVRVVDLSRNFGHHKAMMTGLAYARGDLIFLIDCDLEEDPELLGSFRVALRESRSDVVFGVQKSRKGYLSERLTGFLFYTLFNFLSTDPIPRNLLTVRLMTKRYVSALIQHQEREVMLAGLLVITGFKQTPIAVQKHHRGATTYNVRRKISLAVNSVTSFSNKPLVFIFYLGCLIFFLSSMAAIWLVVRRVFFGVLLEGWPSLIVSIWMLGGLTIFCLGIIGSYLSKMFVEIKQRPYTIVRTLYERNYKHDPERVGY